MSLWMPSRASLAGRILMSTENANGFTNTRTVMNRYPTRDLFPNAFDNAPTICYTDFQQFRDPILYADVENIIRIA